MRKLYKRGNDNIQKLCTLIRDYLNNLTTYTLDTFFEKREKEIIKYFINNFYDEKFLKENLIKILNNFSYKDYSDIKNIIEKETDDYGHTILISSKIEPILIEESIINLYKNELIKYLNLKEIKNEILLNLNIKNIDNNIYEKAIKNLFNDEVYYYGVLSPIVKFVWDKIDEFVPQLLKENNQNSDNWNYENNIDNKFEERPNKRINRILKRMYKDARRTK